jgi:hypothetical protein
MFSRDDIDLEMGNVILTCHDKAAFNKNTSYSACMNIIDIIVWVNILYEQLTSVVSVLDYLGQTQE